MIEMSATLWALFAIFLLMGVIAVIIAMRVDEFKCSIFVTGGFFIAVAFIILVFGDEISDLGTTNLVLITLVIVAILVIVIGNLTAGDGETAQRVISWMVGIILLIAVVGAKALNVGVEVSSGVIPGLV